MIELKIMKHENYENYGIRAGSLRGDVRGQGIIRSGWRAGGRGLCGRSRLHRPPVDRATAEAAAIFAGVGVNIAWKAGLMQVNVQIPSGIPPGGYIPIVLQVGDASTTPAAVWIAISGG